MITLADVKQSVLGAFTGVLFLFAVRAGDPIMIAPMVGLGITLFLLWAYYNGFRMQNKMIHYIMNVAVTLTISALLSVLFELVAYETLFTFPVFGSSVIVGFWVGLPIAMLFDRKELTNPMDRFFVRKQR